MLQEDDSSVEGDWVRVGAVTSLREWDLGNKWNRQTVAAVACFSKSQEQLGVLLEGRPSKRSELHLAPTMKQLTRDWL